MKCTKCNGPMIIETPPETNKVYTIGVHGQDRQPPDVWKCQTDYCWEERKVTK